MTNSKNTNPKNDNAKEEVKTGTSQLKKIVMQAIDELDDTKLCDGVYMRGDVSKVNCFEYNSKSYREFKVRLDCERQVNIQDRPDGPYYKIVIQGCRGAGGNIGRSSSKKGGHGTQYATVLVHTAFGQAGAKAPPAEVFKACMRSSAARCNENPDNDNVNAIAMTVVIRRDGAWINEVTGEVGNVPEGAEPPKLKTDGKAKVKADEDEDEELPKGKKGKGKGKKGR